MSYAHNKKKKTERQSKPKKGHVTNQLSVYIDRNGHLSRSGLIGPVK